MSRNRLQKNIKILYSISLSKLTMTTLCHQFLSHRNYSRDPHLLELKRISKHLTSKMQSLQSQSRKSRKLLFQEYVKNKIISSKLLCLSSLLCIWIGMQLGGQKIISLPAFLKVKTMSNKNNTKVNSITIKKLTQLNLNKLNRSIKTCCLQIATAPLWKALQKSCH